MDPQNLDHRDAKILIIDDEPACALTLAHMLEQSGYANCTTVTDPNTAVEKFHEIKPDLLLVDLHMEPLSGIEIVNQINAAISPRLRAPVIFVTGDTAFEAKHDALAAGATDFISKPIDSVEVVLRIGNILTARALYQQCQLYSHGLERLVDKRTAELQSQTADLEKALAELSETQQQVIQQERMRALGTMASGIAHDLNNNLTLILGYGDMLLTDLGNFPKGSQTRSFLKQVVSAGRDNAELVKRLRDFYRPSAGNQEKDLAAVDLNDLVEEALTHTVPRWKSWAHAGGATIRIVRDLGEIPLINGAGSELREVLTNLIFNAADAMPAGGRLSFRTYQIDGQVRLAVTDDGLGMTEETRRNCLEPFFTTKGDRGSGLGLAMSYGIVRRHGGTIKVESAPGKGSTFTISLPVPAEILEHHAGKTNKPVSPLRVLVVDDHPGICEIVSAYLAEDRHIVETATGAREAMEKFQAGEFDLVITDRAMPEMNGDELATSIKRMKPGEPIIMLTGFADLIYETGQKAESVDLVLSKPARLDDLRKAIRYVMPQACLDKRA
jgi:signal transduction histidine kinase